MSYCFYLLKEYYLEMFVELKISVEMPIELNLLGYVSLFNVY